MDLDGSEWGWVDLSGPGWIWVDLVDLSGSGWICVDLNGSGWNHLTKNRFRCINIAVFKKGSQKAWVFDTLPKKVEKRLGALRRGRLKYRFLRGSFSECELAPQ